MPRSRSGFARSSCVAPVHLSVLVLFGILGCGPSRGERVVAAESGAVDVSIPRPTFTLDDTDGKPFAFAQRTAGRLTFLEFGYTNCPDVCPVHLANLSAVLAKLAPSDRMRTTVVFVTVDPDRDSSAVLRKWLDSFDASFVGLRGTREQIDAAQRLVGFGPAAIQPVIGGAQGATTVSHAAPVVVFTADDTAHVMYPFGTRQSDWTRDIPLLLARGDRAASLSVAAVPTIERAYVVIPAGQGPAALYFVARNPSATADTILAIGTESIGTATLHQSMEDKATGTMHMMAVAALDVPARGTARLAPGGFHGMIGPLARALVRGERIALTVRFEHAGVVRAEAIVITYADVDTATAPRN